MVVFGGFADWQRSMRFMLTGRLANGETTEPDPLNRSVVFLNMIPWLDGVPSNPEPLASLRTEFIHQTWEQPSMEKPEKIAARTLSDEANPSKPFLNWVWGCALALYQCWKMRWNVGNRVLFSG